MLNENVTNNERNIGNLMMSGAGVSGGGIFNEVRISGSGKINGDIECTSMKTSGSSKVDGNIKAGSIGTSGSCKVNGNVDSEEIKTSGSCRFERNVFVKDFASSGSSRIGMNLTGGKANISGSAYVGGKVTLEELKISGSISIVEDCEVASFKSNGGFKIGGLLNSDNVDVKINGKCRVKEIGGERITVKRGRDVIWGFQKIIDLFIPFGIHMETEIIEGDEIFLEYTKAKIVRGNNIVIGNGAVIDIVEFSGSLEILPGAIVREQRKLP